MVEFIIIDGGSTDGSIDIITQNRHLISRFISEPDDGVYYAMEKGIKLSNGRFIYFLGSDDILLPDFSKSLGKLINNKIIYCFDVRRKSNGKIIDGSPKLYRIAVDGLCHQGIIYPKEVFDKYKFKKEYRIFADNVLNLELAFSQDFKFEYNPLLIAEYNDITGLSKTEKDEAFLINRYGILREFLPWWLSWVVIMRMKIVRCLDFIGVKAPFSAVKRLFISR